MAPSTSQIADQIRDLHLSQSSESESEGESAPIPTKDDTSVERRRYPNPPISLPFGGIVDYIVEINGQAQRTVFKSATTCNSRNDLSEIRTINISGQPGYNTWMESYPPHMYHRYFAKRKALERLTMDDRLEYVGYALPKFIMANDLTRTLTLTRVIFEAVINVSELAAAADTKTLRLLKGATHDIISDAWQLGIRVICEKELLRFGMAIFKGQDAWCPMIQGWSYAEICDSDEKSIKDGEEKLRRELESIDEVFRPYLQEHEEMQVNPDEKDKEDMLMGD